MNKEKVQRRDGKYYQAEGDSSYGFVELLNYSGQFEDKLGHRFKSFDEARIMIRLFQREFNRGFDEGQQLSNYDDSTMFGFDE